MEYYLAIKNEEILPFVTTWTELEGIMLSKVSQRKTNTVRSHLCVESITEKKLFSNKCNFWKGIQLKTTTLKAGR